MVEVYRKKLENLQSSNHQMGGMEDQTAKYIEQIMTLENENRKIASLQKILEESQSKTKKLESHIVEVDDALFFGLNRLNRYVWVPMTKTTTAGIRRRRPPHMMLVFSRFSPKKVPFEDTTETVVALAVGRWDGGRGRPRRRGRPPRSAP